MRPRGDELRATLAAIPPADRDAWLDRLLGLDAIPADTALPPQCVPYLPCPVDALLRLIDQTPVRASDTFVDVGSGAGRAAALVQLLTGARTICLEIQPALVEASRELAARLSLDHFTVIEMDASTPGTKVPSCAMGRVRVGTEPPSEPASADAPMAIYFLYCPFSGERLARFLDNLEPIARAEPLSICCVDVTLPERPWLELARPIDRDLAIYRSTRPLHNKPGALSRAGQG
jgi:hypothetical protein